jgi:CBS domain-containing protein
MIPLTVQEVMTTPPPTIAPDAPARTAARRLSTGETTALVVVEGEYDIRGVVTRESLVELLAEGGDGDRPVSACPSRPARTIEPVASVRRATERIRRGGFAPLAVTYGDVLVGVLTTADLGPYVPRVRLEAGRGVPDDGGPDGRDDPTGGNGGDVARRSGDEDARRSGDEDAHRAESQSRRQTGIAALFRRADESDSRTRDDPPSAEPDGGVADRPDPR